MNITERMTVKTIRTSKDYNDKVATKVLIDLGKQEVKDSGRMWRTVCSMVLRHPELLTPESTLESFMDSFGNILESSLPEGLEVPLAKKTGKPAFRSWEVTKPRWQYANYIYNAIVAKGGIDVVFPENEPLPTLAQVRKMQKNTSGNNETPIDTIVRCLELAGKKMSEIELKDHHVVNSMIHKLQTSWGEVVTSTIKKVGPENYS